MIIISKYVGKKIKLNFLKNLILTKNLKLINFLNLKNLLKIINQIFLKKNNNIFLKKYKFFFFFLNYFTSIKKKIYNFKKMLYVIFNNNKKQTFVNILNNVKKNKIFLSTGSCIKLNKKIQTKSLKKSTKGLLMLINVIKKNLVLNKNLIFFFLMNSSKKISILILKELSLFLKKLNITKAAFCWQIKLKNKNNFIKVRRIKRRLKKRIVKHESGTIFN